MELYYRNETLYVDVTKDINLETITSIERRLFRILDDYGINRVVISIRGFYDKHLLSAFKRKYYHKYSGNLLIK